MLAFKCLSICGKEESVLLVGTHRVLSGTIKNLQVSLGPEETSQGDNSALQVGILLVSH